MKEYSKEELEELYKELPEDLQKALFSNEIGEKVQAFCYERDILEEEVINKILKKLGYVFLGLLSPNEFKEEMKTDKVKDFDIIWAKINNEVLMELKDGLDALYEISLTFEKIEDRPISKEKRKKRERKASDKYLEPLD
jgi:hypothetical protein